MPRRLTLVVNPHAGGGRTARTLPAVEQTLRAAGHDLRVTPTRSLSHAEELAAEAVADDRVVVAMGGDGIVGRVAGTVADGGGLLGVVPGGRGNDFARYVGLPRSPTAACTTLSDGVERRLDLGRVDGVPFVGIASVGFDSDVQERSLVSRLPLGQAVYLWASLATVASWRPASFTLRVDGVPARLRGWSVAACNSGVYGGGMRLAPDASTDDGELDLVTTSETTRLRFLAAFPKVFRGTHVGEASVTVRRARVVEVDADRPFRVFADGDPVGTLPCTISVQPGALRVLLPRR